MRRLATNELLEHIFSLKAHFLSFSLDGSTDIANSQVYLVGARIDEKEYCICTFIPERSDENGLVAGFMDKLVEDFPQLYGQIKNGYIKIVSIAADGASVMRAFVRGIREKAVRDDIIGFKEVLYVHDIAHSFQLLLKNKTVVEYKELNLVSSWLTSKQSTSGPFHKLIIKEYEYSPFSSLETLYELIDISDPPRPEKLHKNVETRWLSQESKRKLYTSA